MVWVAIKPIQYRYCVPDGMASHFGSYQESKLSVTQRKGQYSEVKSNQLGWAGQYKKCVQYDFQFIRIYFKSDQMYYSLSKCIFTHN